MKIQWPWTKLQQKVAQQQREIDNIKDALERARVAQWLRIVPYHRGMSLTDDRPAPISLSDLNDRVFALEREASTN